MEPLSDPLMHWLLDYGSLALFVLLGLGIIALPIPDETLMVVAGVLIKKGDLLLIPTALAAYGGAMTGISISYLLGSTLSFHFIKKYGGHIGLTESKMERVHNWFERYGRWVLLFGYFIPGIRHLTGFSAGISRMRYREFSLFAYSGALLWASLFLILGYALGEYWISMFHYIQSNLNNIVVLVLCVGAAYYLYAKFLKSKKRGKNLAG